MSRGGRDPLFSLLEIRYIWGIYLEGYWFVLCPRTSSFKDSIRRMALKSLRIGWAVVRKDSCSSSCCRNQTQLVPLFGLRRFFMDCWQGDGSDDKCQSARLGRSISEDPQPVVTFAETKLRWIPWIKLRLTDNGGCGSCTLCPNMSKPCWNKSLRLEIGQQGLPQVFNSKRWPIPMMGPYS